ncbi:hypothetical protein [Leifsonia xyli]|uniref:hypothetical protein n=1 Tax=Leifsonia xyli TaxID=1575 RepID=UPI001CB80223|nr:hypothetical protein [Leifsonia xyli]
MSVTDENGKVTSATYDALVRRTAVWLPNRSQVGPVLLIIGGIVSVKEQWGQMLPIARRLGVTIAVAEAPGVGENTLPYLESHRSFVSDVLDAIGVGSDADVRVLALSFSLSLAVHAAATDPRLRAIVTVGGPVRAFFDDDTLWDRVPRTTADTWASILGTSSEQAGKILRATAPPPDVWQALRIPIAYVASVQDEIVPVTEVNHLRELVSNAHVLVHDDVHGAPAHLGVTRLWLLGRLLAAPGPHRGKVWGTLAGLGARDRSGEAADPSCGLNRIPDWTECCDVPASGCCVWRGGLCQNRRVSVPLGRR